MPAHFLRQPQGIWYGMHAAATYSWLNLPWLRARYVEAYLDNYGHFCFGSNCLCGSCDGNSSNLTDLIYDLIIRDMVNHLRSGLSALAYKAMKSMKTTSLGLSNFFGFMSMTTSWLCTSLFSGALMLFTLSRLAFSRLSMKRSPLISFGTCS